jgi:hypothetical protein
VLGHNIPENSEWKVPNGYIAKGWLLFLQEQIKVIIIIKTLMMLPFICSYRNKNEPTAIYPSFG